MAINKASEEYLQALIEKVKAGSAKATGKQVYQAGKELVLLCLWVEAVGAKPSTDLPTFLAGLFMDYPEELKRILGLYESLKKRPDITKGIIQSFSVKMMKGELLVHFNWTDYSDEKLVDIVDKMKALDIKPL